MPTMSGRLPVKTIAAPQTQRGDDGCRRLDGQDRCTHTQQAEWMRDQQYGG
jgi:hypothetical protein